MKISILGTGNVGCATACDLAYRGHDVTLIKTSQAANNDNFSYICTHDNQIIMDDLGGKTFSAKIKAASYNIADISDSDIILVMIQTTYHEEVIKKMIPYLKKDQIVLFNPGYLATAYMLKHGARDDVIVVEAESSFIDCRIQDFGHINVSFRNVRNPLGIYPNARKEEAIEKLEQLGFPFRYLSSVIEAALHNPNLIVHTVGAVMSIPRIEKTNGNYYMYHEVFTPSVWNILEQLDNEKMNVLEKLGFKRLAYVDACKFRNSLDDEKDAKAVFFEYADDPNSVKGPTSVDSRYITEDIPQGLVLLESLGEHLEVKTTVASSIIQIASVALGRDLRAYGRTLGNLGTENVNKLLADCGHQIIISY